MLKCLDQSELIILLRNTHAYDVESEWLWRHISCQRTGFWWLFCCCWVFVCVFCFVFYYASGSMILSLTGVHDHRADIERNRTVNYLVEQTRNVDVTCFDTTRVAILLKEENMSLRCVTCD